MSNLTPQDSALSKSEQMEEDKRTNSMLDPFWEEGMQTPDSELVASAMSSTGLSKPVIKRYMRLKKKRVDRAALKASGKLPERKKKDRQKDIRGYDLFMSERLMKEDLKGLSREQRALKFKIANAAWKALSKKEKGEWKEKARLLNAQNKAPVLNIKRSIKKMGKECKKLWQKGVKVNLLVPPIPGRNGITVEHPSEMQPYWNGQEGGRILHSFGKEIQRCEFEAMKAPTNIPKSSRGGSDKGNIEEAQVHHDVAIGMQGHSGMSGATAEFQAPTMIQADNTSMEISGAGAEIQAPMTIENVSTTNPSEMVSISMEGQGTVEIETGNTGTAENQIVQDFQIVFIQENQPEDETNEVTVEHMSQEEALKNAHDLAKKNETESGLKKNKGRARIVGKKIKHLWTMNNRKESDDGEWFEGVIVKRCGKNYMIKYEDEEELRRVPVTDFKKFIKRQTLFFI